MDTIAVIAMGEMGAAVARADMFTGAAVLYQRVADDNRIGPQSEILSILNRFVEPR